MAAVVEMIKVTLGSSAVFFPLHDGGDDLFAEENAQFLNGVLESGVVVDSNGQEMPAVDVIDVDAKYIAGAKRQAEPGEQGQEHRPRKGHKTATNSSGVKSGAKHRAK